MNNYKKGAAAEYQYMKKNWLFRYSGQRSYGSKGLFDCIFIDKEYNIRLVQVKKATKATTKPRIKPSEIWEIQTFIDQFLLKGIEHIWIGYVLIPYRKPAVEVRLNWDKQIFKYMRYI